MWNALAGALALCFPNAKLHVAKRKVIKWRSVIKPTYPFDKIRSDRR
jgi:hypothetical protein